MKRNAIQTYALAVCFASLFAGTIALSVAIYDVVQISFPEATNDSVSAQLQAARNRRSLANEQFQTDLVASSDSAQPSNRVSPTITIANPGFYVRQAIQSLTFSSIVILLCAIIFLFHWRMAKLHDQADA